MKRINVVRRRILAATTTVAGAKQWLEAPDALVADAVKGVARFLLRQVEVLKIGAHGAESSVFDIEHRAPDHTRKTFSAPAAVGGDS